MGNIEFMKEAKVAEEGGLRGWMVTEGKVSENTGDCDGQKHGESELGRRVWGLDEQTVGGMEKTRLKSPHIPGDKDE